MDILKRHVIAAVKSREELEEALSRDIEIIFDLCSSILTLGEVCKMVHSCGKMLFVHLDLAEGIGRDKSGIEFAKQLGVDGIISTRASIIKMAKEAGLYTVQRLFILDSKSVDTAIESLRQSKTDMVEVMPGVVSKVISRLVSYTDIPIIAGGLIDAEEEVRQALNSGAAAISTGKKELWRMY